MKKSYLLAPLALTIFMGMTVSANEVEEIVVEVPVTTVTSNPEGIKTETAKTAPAETGAKEEEKVSELGEQSEKPTDSSEENATNKEVPANGSETPTPSSQENLDGAASDKTKLDTDKSEDETLKRGSARVGSITTVVAEGQGLSLQYTKDIEPNEKILFAVWSDDKGQDDLVWYNASAQGAAYVELSRHKSYGLYHIHTYANRSGKMVGLNALDLNVKPSSNSTSENPSDFKAQSNLPNSGTYTFTASAPVKSEAKVSSPTLAIYQSGQKVNYDKVLVAEGREWLSYISYGGNRRYVPIREVSTTSTAVAPTVPTKPVEPAVSTTKESSPLPSSGTYTFTASAPVKSEAKVSSPTLATYQSGQKVNYDSVLKADGREWLSYISYGGNRRYVPIREVSMTSTTVAPTVPTKPVEPTDSTTSPTVSTTKESSPLPSSGTYTFTASAPVKSEPKISSPTLATYQSGQKVNYDSVLKAEGREWLSYISYGGNRRYVPIREVSTTSTAVAPTVPTKPVEPAVSTTATTPSSGTSASQGNYDVLNNIIYLDAGHGGSDPGAGYYGLAEKNLNLQMQGRVKSKLEALGYQVVLTRTDDRYVGLLDRSKKVNATQSDLFLSIHFNASPNASQNGIETYWYEYDSDYPARVNPTYHNNPERLNRSRYLAEAIQSGTVAQTGANNRGVLRNTFAVLRETTAPAVLVELGYMSNQAESQKIAQASYQEKLADGIVAGIQNYYAHYTNGKTITQPNPAVTPTLPLTSSLPSSGTYTFTSSAPVKSEAKVSSPTLATYQSGQKVNYDKVLVAEGHEWLSYISYGGNRRYVPIREVKAPTTPEQPATETTTPKTPLVKEAGDLAYNGAILKKEVVDKIVSKAKEHDILPSYALTVLHFEGLWGTSATAQADNNWAGMTWHGSGNRPSGVTVTRGSERPKAEGGHFMHYASVDDFLTDWFYHLSSSGYYKVAGQTTFADSIKGMFKEGGARYDYAASGYKYYLEGATKRLKAIEAANGSLAKYDGAGTVSTTSSVSPVTPSTLPSSGTYTFTTSSPVKAEAKTSSPTLAIYQSGEKVNYDKVLVAEGQEWLSYISYGGNRRYVPIRKAVTEDSKTPEITSTTATSKVTGKVSSRHLGTGVYQVTVSQAPIEGDILYAVWSESHGQDDLRWYESLRSGTGAEGIFNVADHKNTGSYHIHAYQRHQGKMTFLGATIQTVPQTEYQNLPHYLQWDGRWGSRRYGDWTMGDTGCVPTALSMIYTALSNKTVWPTEVADYLYNHTNEFNHYEEGTSGKGILLANKHFGYTSTVLNSQAALEAALSEGHYVVAAVQNNKFVLSGSHELVLKGFKNGMTYVTDPWSRQNTGWYPTANLWKEQSRFLGDVQGVGKPFIKVTRL